MAEVLPHPQPAEPGRPAVPYVARREIRVSDAERQAVVDELRVHYGAGRVDLAEFEDRTQAALSSRVRGDLYPLLDDLPDLGPPPGAAVEHVPASPSSRSTPAVARPARTRPLLDSALFRGHLYITLVISAFLVVLYLGASGSGMFWPIFPIAGLSLPLGFHAAVRKAAG